MLLPRLIETAEMLKPATPSGGQDNNHDSTTDFYPHIVFVLNEAGSDEFNLENYDNMQATLAKIYAHSKLKITGTVN